jgi:hypothetical protein
MFIKVLDTHVSMSEFNKASWMSLSYEHFWKKRMETGEGKRRSGRGGREG